MFRLRTIVIAHLQIYLRPRIIAIFAKFSYLRQLTEVKGGKVSITQTKGKSNNETPETSYPTGTSNLKDREFAITKNADTFAQH